MASWLQSQFRQVEDFLETVDRTAATVAVIRERKDENKADLRVDEQLAALEPVGLRKPSFGREKVSVGRTPVKQPTTLAADGPIRTPPSVLKSEPAVKPLPSDSKGVETPRIRQEVRKAAENSTAVPVLETGSVALNRGSEGGLEEECKEGLELVERESAAIEAVEQGGYEAGEIDGPTGEATGSGGSDQIEESKGGEIGASKDNLLAGEEVADETVEGEEKEIEKEPESVNGVNESGTESVSPSTWAPEVVSSFAVSNGVHERGDLPSPGAHSDSDDHRGSKTSSVQRDLDEARGLLKSAASGGQSKEARLARICASLSQRLQEYKAENAQLEELLTAERNGRGTMDSTVRALQQQLAQAQAEMVAAEASVGTALAAKNHELDALAQALADSKRQAVVLEGQLASFQANTEVISKSRDATEARMIQALREELISTERRCEEERAAHTATRQAAAQREMELEQRVTESASGLTRMQKALDERTEKTSNLEDKISMLEVECATLSQELQSLEARLKREQKVASEDSTMGSQVQAWREEAERARHMQHEAEAKRQAMEAENQKLRVEVEARKREADSSSLQANAELEKRFRELTELLYLKQTQLEAMSSEKQAALLHLEKERRRSREAKVQAERDRTTRRAVVHADDDDQELRSFESLGLHQRQIVGPRIQQAAKLLDHGTVTAGRFLWRRPLARLGFFFYLVFVHLFLMYLLHRLQEQADDIISRDNASIAAEAASGLVKPNHFLH